MTVSQTTTGMSDVRPLRRERGRRARACLLNLLFFAITCLGVASTAEGAITLIVNSTRDVVDAAPGNGVCDTGALNTQGAIECTLRAAIEETNALAGADNIDFNIPTTELGYSAAPLSYTIQPASQLPNITDTVTIDGSTQPDFPGDPIVELDGTFAGGTSKGLEIFAAGAGSTIRGLVINTFDIRGIHVSAANVTIVGNWIGLDTDGLTAAGNDDQGIFGTSSSDGLTLGGIVALDRNVISANGRGIHIRGDNNVVIGNYFGTDSTGTVTVAGSFGSIRLEIAADGAMIGGDTAADANIIAGNSADGIDHRSTGTANSFLGNSIYSNGGIGIDLAHDGATSNGANGVTANDALDPDSGSNNFLNFPELTAAMVNGGTVTVDFDLDVPAGDYRIEFFTNPSGADSSGYGEGEVFTSTININHTGGGPLSFSHAFAGAVGDIITTTNTSCTDGSCTAFLATSEFSQFATAVVPAVIKRAFWLDGTPIPTGVDIPSGVQFRFMLYVSNPGALVADVSMQDLLAAAFSYVGGSIMYDNSVVNCAADPCTALEEAAIFTAVDSGTVGTDPVNGDVVSYIGSTLDVGNEIQANLQLDILGNRVWAVMFTATIL